MKIEHGAHEWRDEEAWEDGVWEVALLGRTNPIDLGDDEDDGSFSE